MPLDLRKYNNAALSTALMEEVLVNRDSVYDNASCTVSVVKDDSSMISRLDHRQPSNQNVFSKSSTKVSPVQQSTNSNDVILSGEDAPWNPLGNAKKSKKMLTTEEKARLDKDEAERDARTEREMNKEWHEMQKNFAVKRKAGEQSEVDARTKRSRYALTSTDALPKSKTMIEGKGKHAVAGNSIVFPAPEADQKHHIAKEEDVYSDTENSKELVEHSTSRDIVTPEDRRYYMKALIGSPRASNDSQNLSQSAINTKSAKQSVLRTSASRSQGSAVWTDIARRQEKRARQRKASKDGVLPPNASLHGQSAAGAVELLDLKQQHYSTDTQAVALRDINGLEKEAILVQDTISLVQADLAKATMLGEHYPINQAPQSTQERVAHLPTALHTY